MQTKYLQIILIGKLFNFKLRKIFGKDVNSFQKHAAMVIWSMGEIYILNHRRFSKRYIEIYNFNAFGHCLSSSRIYQKDKKQRYP